MFKNRNFSTQLLVSIQSVIQQIFEEIGMRIKINTYNNYLFCLQSMTR